MIILKLNLLLILVAQSLYSCIWPLYSAPVEHPGLSYHYLLPITFHSLFSGLMVFILDTLYTHGSQSDVMKIKVRSHHAPSLNPSVVPRIIKLKSQHLFTPHKTPYDLVPAKTFDLSPTSFGLAHYMLHPRWPLAVSWAVVVYSCL